MDMDALVDALEAALAALEGEVDNYPAEHPRVAELRAIIAAGNKALEAL